MRLFRIGLAFLAGLGLSQAVAGQDGLAVIMPIDCALGRDCNIQNYVDRDPGKDAFDFRCGHLTYDGHKGTDFRIRDLALMHRGVTVRAAAAGRVLGTRNTMPDINFKKYGKAALKGRDCGNGVRIDHGGGWVTQYCHMRRGSVRVQPGEWVETGDELGLVGQSGRAEFPHLHFQLEFNRRPVDPFVGKSAATGCRVRERPLWRDMRRNGLGYKAVGLIDAGFTERRPTLELIEKGELSADALSRHADALVFWVKLFGVRPGDRQRLAIYDPAGAVIVDNRPKPVNRPKAQWMAFVGKRAPRRAGRESEPWPKTGDYRGIYTLDRGGRTVVRAERTVRVE